MAANKKKLAALIALLLIAIIAVIVFIINKNKNPFTATTIRIAGYEGEVSLDNDGDIQKLREDMQMRDGNGLITAKESYVDLNLDDTKAAGLDETSSADFSQEGKKISINLKKGGLYFYTTEKLKDNENFDIETETMMVGIRGTSGSVHVDEKTGEASLWLGSGEVEVTAYNPVTNATRTATVSAGQKIRTYRYDEKQGTDSITFEISEFKADEMPGVYARALTKAGNEEVLKRVEEETGFKESDIKKSINNDSYDGPVLSSISKNDSAVAKVDTNTSTEDSGNNSVISAVPTISDRMRGVRDVSNDVNADTSASGRVTEPSDIAVGKSSSLYWPDESSSSSSSSSESSISSSSESSISSSSSTSSASSASSASS